MARSLHFLHGYAVVGAALVGNLLKDAYSRAQVVCELFPEFEFLATFQDEILLHHTRLPVVNVPITTLAVVIALVAGFIATYVSLIERLWLFLIDLVSGRLLYHIVYVLIPTWLPFLASEPGVPDLLSDPEDTDNSIEAAFPDATAAACAVAAMAKLQEVKRRHANCTIERPDDWLVFDPEQEQLVPKKDWDAKKLRRKQVSPGSSSSSSSSTSTSTSSPGCSPTERKRPSGLTYHDGEVDAEEDEQRYDHIETETVFPLNDHDDHDGHEEQQSQDDDEMAIDMNGFVGHQPTKPTKRTSHTTAAARRHR